MKFSDLYQDWVLNKQDYVKRSTMSAYSLLAINHLIPAFGEYTQITESMVQDFVLKKIKGGLSQKSVKDILIVLKMILKYGQKYNLFPYTHFDLIYPTDHERKTIEVLSPANFKRIIQYTKDNFSFRNLGVLICLSTGMRIGEICALKWEDIDIETGTIKVRRTIQRIYTIENDGKKATELIIDTPKTKTSNREIPMSKDILSICKPLFKIINQDFFVLTNDAKPTEPRTYRSYYKRVMDELEIPLIKFHGLRHSFATQCIAKKIDVKTVSVLLGHSNVSTTFNLYVHPDMEQKKSAINQLFK